LHEGRPELIEHLAQMLTARRRSTVAVLGDVVTRQEIGDAVGFEEVAEPVANGDLGDLRDPAKSPWRGLYRHAASVARGLLGRGGRGGRIDLRRVLAKPGLTGQRMGGVAG